MERKKQQQQRQNQSSHQSVQGQQPPSQLMVATRNKGEISSPATSPSRKKKSSKKEEEALPNKKDASPKDASPLKTSLPPTPVAELQDGNAGTAGTATGAATGAGAVTGTGADEKPSADAGSQEDVHGTGSQDASASGREDGSGQKDDTDAPQESQEHVPQESVELKQPALPVRKENVETKSDQKPELPAPEEHDEAALTPPAPAKPAPEEKNVEAAAPAPDVAVPDKENVEDTPEENVEAAAPAPSVAVPEKENVEDKSDSSESSQLPEHLEWPEVQPNGFYPFGEEEKFGLEPHRAFEQFDLLVKNGTEKDNEQPEAAAFVDGFCHCLKICHLHEQDPKVCCIPKVSDLHKRAPWFTPPWADGLVDVFSNEISGNILFYDKDNDCMGAIPSGKPGKVTVNKNADEPGQEGYFFNVDNTLVNEKSYQGSDKLEIGVIGPRYLMLDGPVKIEKLSGKIKQFNVNREADCNLVNWYHFFKLVAIVFDSDYNRFFNGIHDKLIEWIARIHKKEEWSQEPYANPDFSSWKNAICEQLHTLISKIETYLAHRYKCIIVEEFRIMACINDKIHDLGGWVGQYYELDKDYRGSHPLTSGPESNDPKVVENKISAARVTCSWIHRIVTQDGIEFVPSAKSRQCYQLAMERGKSGISTFFYQRSQRLLGNFYPSGITMFHR